MTKYEIINTIARKAMVETLVSNIARQPMNADLMDLAQMVYLVLLEYDDERLVEMWETNHITYFIARIIINQFRSHNSPYHAQIRKFRSKSEELTGKDWIDE